jgi:NTE family protein
LSDDVVASFIQAQPGEPLDVDELNEDIADLYGLGSFGRISYDIVTEQNQTGLVLRAVENRAWRDYFRFGILLESDFESDADFQIGASYTKRNVNRAGGEWRSLAQIGGDQVIATDFYQPLGARMKFFVNPLAFLRRGNSPIFDGGSTPTAEVRVDAAELGLDAGMQLGRWGELRVGVHKASGTVKPIIGDPGFDRISFDDSFSLVRFDIDTLDQLNFPRHGTFLRTQWIDHDDAASGDFSFSEFSLKSFTTRSWNQNTLLLGGKFSRTFDADNGLFSGFGLGGFLNLSGLARDQLFGANLVYAQAAYYRELASGSSLFKIPVYVGGSIEAGNVYDDIDDFTAASLIVSGSIFVGVDSIIGPIYVAGGLTEDGDTAVYFFVGQVF